MRARDVGLVSLTATLLLAACNQPAEHKTASSSTTEKAKPGAPAPATCTLFELSEMSAAIGKPVKRQEERTARRCIYYTDDPLVYVDVEIDRQSAAEAWKGVNTGNALIGAAQDDLAGIGDQAFFGPRDRLYVLRKDAFIAVEAGFDAEVRDRAKRVAMLVLSKVPS